MEINNKKRYFMFGGFNTLQVLKYGLTNDDLHLLSYIKNCNNSSQLEKIFENDNYYVWLKNEKIVEDNPTLYFKESMLKIKIQNLLKKEMIEKIVKCQKGTSFKKSYYRTTEKFSELKFLYVEENNNVALTNSIDIRDKILDKDVNNDNLKENDVNIIKDKKDLKVSFGTYGRIKLTQKEYDKLEEEFGRNKIEAQIKLVDEYIESNNNKNKYTNYNLVIRKSIRDNWFDNKNSNNQFKPRTQTAKDDEEGAI